MVDVLDIIKSWQDNTGAICAKLSLQVSTAEDLPSIGDVVGGMKVQAGSFAQIIQANTIVTLDDDTDSGTWYPEQS
jgi:hypothetical protein